MTDLEYRALWVETIAGRKVPFSGKVGTFVEAEAERLFRETCGFTSTIEVRAKSDEP